MGYTDLAAHYAAIGHLQAALKYYTSTRDYLTISYHILEMSMNVIQVLFIIIIRLVWKWIITIIYNNIL